MARSLPATLVTALALALAGCGGGGGGDEERGAATPTATAKPARTVTIEQIEALARERKRREERERQAQATPEPTAAAAVPSPDITKAFIPFPAKRKQEMAAYAQRHYGLDTYRLEDPSVIVEHYTVTDDAAAAIALFEPDTPDPELGELPNVCSHFVIDRDGTIYQLVPLTIMCRHTVGLNYTAIGIEHAGFSADEVLGDDAQMASSLALTRWLQCRYGIDTADVIGHNESLSSPYHREQVAELRDQTHDDFNADEMADYRERLTEAGGC
jgi:N-acetylmuramoyl-L-alanine amidase-like protein